MPSYNKAIQHFQASGFEVFPVEMFCFFHALPFGYTDAVFILVYRGPWTSGAEFDVFILELS